MTPRMSNIGASIRKMFSGIGGDGDYYWDNVVLGMHMDGVEGGTAFPEVRGRTVTASGNACTRTGNKRAGTASAYFDGTDDYLTVPASADFEFGLGDFTVEAWVYIAADSSADGDGNKGAGILLIDNGNGSRAKGEFMISGDTTRTGTGMHLGLDPGTGWLALAAFCFVPKQKWIHVAYCRLNSVVSFYLDGVYVGGGAFNYAVGLADNPVKIGGRSQFGQYNYVLNGYIDELRITKGVCRYTKNFTPPGVFPEVQLDVVSFDPNWANTVLALRMDGANGGVVFTDMKGKSVAVTGNVNTSTTQKKFGSASAYFDGVGDFLEVASSADFDFGTGDFTLECWVYPVARTDAYPIVFANYLNATADIGLIVKNDGSGELLYDGSYTAFAVSSVPNNVWTHVAVVRYGSELALYVNGTKLVSVARSTPLGRSTNPFYIGNLNNSSTQHRFMGYIDDLRFTKGLARYQANFPAPTQPFATGEV